MAASPNVDIEVCAYEICAEVLGPVAQDWIREQWSGWNPSTFIPLATAMAACLPFEEGFNVQRRQGMEWTVSNASVTGCVGTKEMGEGMEQLNTMEEGVQEAQTLLATLRRQKWPEQYEAINNLALSANPLADTVLFHLLALCAPFVREAALKALAVRSEILGRVAARAMLDDASSLVRNAAAELLGQMGDRQDVRRLSRALRDNDWVTRATVADSLGQVGGKAAYAALKQAMTHDSNPIVRRDAAFALCYAKQSEVVPDLEQALTTEKQEQTQIGLLGALYALGRAEYLDALLKLLDSEDSSVRHAVLNSLKEIVRPDDKEQAIQAIRDMLRHEDNPGLRIDGAKAADEIAGIAAAE